MYLCEVLSARHSPIRNEVRGYFCGGGGGGGGGGGNFTPPHPPLAQRVNTSQSANVERGLNS